MTQPTDPNAPENVAWRDNVMNNVQDRAVGDDKLGSSRNIDSILRIPVQIQVVLGNATMPVASLMNLGRGAIIPLDHRVGEPVRSEEHTSELQSRQYLVCRLLLEKKRTDSVVYAFLSSKPGWP